MASPLINQLYDLALRLDKEGADATKVRMPESRSGLHVLVPCCNLALIPTLRLLNIVFACSVIDLNLSIFPL
jgi:hypothetical protein